MTPIWTRVHSSLVEHVPAASPTCEHCATKLLWTRVQMGVIKSLQRTTLQELVDFASPTEKTLEIHG